MNKNTIQKIVSSHRIELREKFGVTQIGLFGSYARDDAHPASDIDFLVELENPDLFIMAGLKYYLEDLLGKSVDVVRIRKNMNEYLRAKIAREVVYVR